MVRVILGLELIQPQLLTPSQQVQIYLSTQPSDPHLVLGYRNLRIVPPEIQGRLEHTPQRFENYIQADLVGVYGAD